MKLHTTLEKISIKHITLEKMTYLSGSATAARSLRAEGVSLLPPSVLKCVPAPTFRSLILSSARRILASSAGC